MRINYEYNSVKDYNRKYELIPYIDFVIYFHNVQMKVK